VVASICRAGCEKDPLILDFGGLLVAMDLESAVVVVAIAVTLAEEDGIVVV